MTYLPPPPAHRIMDSVSANPEHRTDLGEVQGVMPHTSCLWIRELHTHSFLNFRVKRLQEHHSPNPHPSLTVITKSSYPFPLRSRVSTHQRVDVKLEPSRYRTQLLYPPPYVRNPGYNSPLWFMGGLKILKRRLKVAVKGV